MRTAGAMRFLILTLGTVLRAWSQGTFVYDQQSATNGRATGGSPIQQLQPVGQSFTPNYDSVGFVQLQFLDARQYNGLGSAAFVTLRENSITGNVLAASSPVSMPDSFWGTATFYFPNSTPITPGITYFFQISLLSGEDTDILSDQYNYPGGTSYFLGQSHPNPSRDLWFREGYLAPEPNALYLLLMGITFVSFLTRRRQVRFD